jgi:Domain of unknown function (DUF4160)
MEPTRPVSREAARLIRNVRPTSTRASVMPIISAFFGIVIRMYYKEHEPAHFHAEYAGQQAKFAFDGG